MACRRNKPLEGLRITLESLLVAPDVEIPPGLSALREELDSADRQLADLCLVDLLASDTREVYLVNGQTMRFADVSESAARNLGYSRDEMREMTPLDVITSKNEQNVKQMLAAMQNLVSGSLVVRSHHLRRDGSTYPVEITLLLLDKQVLVIGRDLTRQRRRDQRVEHAIDDLCQPGEGWIATTNAELSIGYASEEVQRATGFSDEEILGATPALWKSGKMPQSFYRRLWARLNAGHPVRERFVNRDRDGQLFEVDQTIAPISGGPGDDSGEPHFVSAGTVVRKEQAVEGHLRYLAYIDSLTSLPNRVLFTELLDRQLAAARAHGQYCALLLVDINRFVYFNETYGSEVGDLLLKQLALRFERLTGETNHLARVGDDEFALLVSHFEQVEELILLADEVRREAARPFPLKGAEVRLSVSVGVATFPDDGEDSQHLFSRAGIALSEARKAGRDCVFFTEQLNRQAAEFLALKEQLISGIEREDVQVAYQPIYRLSDGELVALEALMRFGTEPLCGMSPARFVPALEELRLIVPASAQLCERVCADIRAWIDAGLPAVPVAVNLSALQLHDEDLVASIGATARKYRVDPKLLTLEVTESMCMRDADRAKEALCQLQKQGFSIAIDDFGTGYSSLSQLKHLPVDRLKIDMSFVHGIESEEDAGIIRAVVAMARSLKVDTVAEGIENDAQLQGVRDLACDLGQGFHLCRPLCAKDLVRVLGKRLGAIDAG